MGWTLSDIITRFYRGLNEPRDSDMFSSDEVVDYINEAQREVVEVVAKWRPAPLMKTESFTKGSTITKSNDFGLISLTEKYLSIDNVSWVTSSGNSYKVDKASYHSLINRPDDLLRWTPMDENTIYLAPYDSIPSDGSIVVSYIKRPKDMTLAQSSSVAPINFGVNTTSVLNYFVKDLVLYKAMTKGAEKDQEQFNIAYFEKKYQMLEQKVKKLLEGHASGIRTINIQSSNDW